MKHQLKEQPLVTIGIPTYNRAESFLRLSLGSALAQIYPRLEIIVSDNCSSDGTEAVVREMADERVRYLRHDPALLPHKNADACLREAQGDYFLLLHDDDLIDDDFIQVCVDAIDGREVGLARTGARKIDEAGRIKAVRKNPHAHSTLFEYLTSVLCGEAVTYFCNTLYRTRALREIGGFQSRRFVYQDVIATIKLACQYGRVDIEAPKASYRVHSAKLGKAADIARWCDDSLQLLDVMCQGMPEKTAFFRGEGRRMLCRINYHRVVHLSGVWARLHAYLILIRKFRYFPVGVLSGRIARKMSRIFHRPVQDGAF